jgi:hypothetical protein
MSDQRKIQTLVEQFKNPRLRSDPQIRPAVVVEAGVDTATINLAGTIIADVPYLEHVAPAVDDVMWVSQDGPDLLGIGMQAAGGGGGGVVSGWLDVGSTGNPAFENGWVNRGGGYAPTSFKKVGELVVVRGFVITGAAGTVFTLPVGYRPTYGIVSFTCWDVNTGTDSHISVYPAGIVQKWTSGGSAALNFSFAV